MIMAKLIVIPIPTTNKLVQYIRSWLYHKEVEVGLSRGYVFLLLGSIGPNGVNNY